MLYSCSDDLLLPFSSREGVSTHSSKRKLHYPKTYIRQCLVRYFGRERFLWDFVELIEKDPRICGLRLWKDLMLNSTTLVNHLMQLKRSSESEKRPENCV